MGQITGEQQICRQDRCGHPCPVTAPSRPQALEQLAGMSNAAEQVLLHACCASCLHPPPSGSSQTPVEPDALQADTADTRVSLSPVCSPFPSRAQGHTQPAVSRPFPRCHARTAVHPPRGDSLALSCLCCVRGGARERPGARGRASDATSRRAVNSPADLAEKFLAARGPLHQPPHHNLT